MLREKKSLSGKPSPQPSPSEGEGVTKRSTLHDRGRRVALILDDCIRRRLSGEAAPDDEIIQSHPELMPELGAELAKLAVIERADQLACHAGDPSEAEPTGDEPGCDDAAELLPSFAGYQVLRRIQHGGQGVVYQAVQLSTKRQVAVKVLHEGLLAGVRDRARFTREVRLLAQIKHPHVVAIHDSGICASGAYFVMDYVEGVALDEYVQATKGSEPGAQATGPSEPRAEYNPGLPRACAELRRPAASRGLKPAARGFSVADTLRLFAKICEAVNAAHLRGIIHRDLKPANIRIDAQGEPHVLDFGLAKLADEALAAVQSQSTISITGQFVGTLPWASPEQAEGRSDLIDVRSDIYSLGVVLYQMLTGAFPYSVLGSMREVLDRIVHAPPLRPSAVSREVDDEVETIVLKCLAKERERRYQSAGELARDVHRYLAGEPIEAKRDSHWYLARKTLRRYRWYFVGAAATLLLLLGTYVTYVNRVAAKDRALIAVQRRRLEAADRRRQAEIPLVKALDLIRRNVLPDRAYRLLGEALAIDPTFALAYLERAQLKEKWDRLEAQPEARFGIEQIVADLKSAHEQAGGDWLQDPQTHRRYSPVEAHQLAVNASGFLVGFPDVRKEDEETLVRVFLDGRTQPVGGPGMPRALFQIGYFLLERGRIQEAKSILAKAAALDPEDVYTRLGQLLNALYESGPTPSVVEALESLSEDNVAKALMEVWMQLAIVYDGQTYGGEDFQSVVDPVKAERAARRTLVFSPENPTAWHIVGRALWHQNKEDALDALRRSVATEPHWAGPWLDLGRLLAEQDRVAEAIDAYREALRRDPERSDAWTELAALYQRAGRPEAAEAALNHQFTEGQH